MSLHKLRTNATVRNRVHLVGSLGTNPACAIGAGNKPVARFRVATSEPYTSQSGTRHHDTQWHSIVAYNMVALHVQTLRKGARVAIAGRLKNRVFTDDSGISRSITEIVADNVIALGSRLHP